MRFYLAFLICTATLVQAQSKETAIPGLWRGESTCVAKNTACRDETVVYRWSAIAARAGWYSASADKVTDGKAVNMGVLEFHYEKDSHLLICEYAQGVWKLTINGAKMEGTLTLPDHTAFRRITLQSVKY